MKQPRIYKIAFFVLLVLFAVGMLAFWLPGLSKKPSHFVSTDPGLGLYLAKMGDCTSCHTAPGGKDFAGGLAITSPMGTIYSTNITPDPDYGIGKYTVEEFARALREGIARDEHRLYPAMPYTSFEALSDEEIAALYDYFEHQVPAVHEQPPVTKLPFPFNQRWGLWFWDKAFLSTHRYTNDPDHDASWNRGAYLAQGLGHCSACHTPRGLAYEEEGSSTSSSFLTGETLDNWYAPNLRGDEVTGLGSWTEEDIVSFLKNGHGAGAAAFGSMAQVVENSTQYMHEDDLKALAHYLKSIEPEKTASHYPPVTIANNDMFERPGTGIYASYCASCHKPSGAGAPPNWPKLAGNPSIVSVTPTSLIRIVLEGGKTAKTDGGPPVRSMPAFASRLNDREIADVLTYIRQSWGNAAGTVTANEVASLRKKLSK